MEYAVCFFCMGKSCVTGCEFSVMVLAYVPHSRIYRGFAFKYGKFLLLSRYLTALSVPKSVYL